MPLRIRAAAAPVGLSLLLASCASIGGGGGRRVSDAPVKIGRPYEVRGVTYVPADVRDYDELGYASWYGKEQAGNDTANGERFNPKGVSAAHRTLPLPSYVEVTALDSGKTVLVRINDRGPFSNKRIIDLSRGAAEQLGIVAGGSAAVRVRRVDPPESERASLRAGKRAPDRSPTPSDTLAGLRARLP